MRDLLKWKREMKMKTKESKESKKAADQAHNTNTQTHTARKVERIKTQKRMKKRRGPSSFW